MADKKIVAEVATADLRFKSGGKGLILQQAWTVSTATKAWSEWRDVPVAKSDAPDSDE